MLAAQLLSVKFRQSPCGPPEISLSVITHRTQTHPTGKAVNTPVIQQLLTAKRMRPWGVNSHCFKSCFFFPITFRNLWQSPHSYYMCKTYMYSSMVIYPREPMALLKAMRGSHRTLVNAIGKEALSCCGWSTSRLQAILDTFWKILAKDKMNLEKYGDESWAGRSLLSKALGSKEATS